MRYLQSDELQSVVGGWGDCPFCEDEAKEIHNEEYDDDVLYKSDYEPKPMPGIWQNYLNWFKPE